MSGQEKTGRTMSNLGFRLEEGLAQADYETVMALVAARNLMSVDLIALVSNEIVKHT